MIKYAPAGDLLRKEFLMISRLASALLPSLVLVTTTGVSGVTAAGTTAASSGYTIIDLGGLPGTVYSGAQGINNRGKIVGFSLVGGTSYHAGLAGPRPKRLRARPAFTRHAAVPLGFRRKVSR